MWRLTVLGDTKMSRVIGLDIASNTGAVVRSITSDYMDWRAFSVDKNDNSLKRATWLGAEIADYAHKQEANLAVIEGYSMASRIGHTYLVTLGTMVRYFLQERGIDFIEVPPSTLKKFVTGKGNSQKDQMRLAVYKTWQFENDELDVIDAFGLAQFGVELMAPGMWKNPKWRQEVVQGWAKKQKK